MSAHRTTFSLDDSTIAALRRLSERWKISQAGVVRRVVQAADQQAAARLTPKQALEQFRNGGIDMSEPSLAALVNEARMTRIAADQHRQ
jgi:hypothetical protein